MEKFKPAEKFSQIKDYWDPKVVAEFNGQQMRIAKIKGEFVWHSHQNEDEVFFILDGNMTIEFRDQSVELETGDIFVVPKGKEHRPSAKEEAKILLIAPAETVNTGETESVFTKKDLDRI